MRIIVISDTHRNYYALEEIIEMHSNADMFIHLGDGRYETDRLLVKYPQYQEKFFYVRGNCDFDCTDSDVLTMWVENHKIIAVHGHNHNVKYSLELLKTVAGINNCDIILYGHTHTRFMKYEDGVYIMNPGSASSPRDGKKPSYGIIDITEKGISMNIADV